jgi:hypothetical protein
MTMQHIVVFRRAHEADEKALTRLMSLNSGPEVLSCVRQSLLQSYDLFIELIAHRRDLEEETFSCCYPLSCQCILSVQVFGFGHSHGLVLNIKPRYCM